MARDFRAELDAASQAEDWDAHARIWDERRCAEVDYDEAMLALWLAHGDDAIFNRSAMEVD